MLSDRYWNPVMETLPHEKIEKLQLKKFQDIFNWAYQHSRFHRGLYKDAGIEQGDIKTLDDIARVPKVEKSMMRAIQGPNKEPYPYGDMLCVPLAEVSEHHETSGTTGQPVFQADSWQDWEWWSEAWAYIMYAQGYREVDRVYLPFGYSIFVAFWAAHYGAEKLGCQIIPGGILNTEARILKMQQLKPTAFCATPTYVLGMADTARKIGIEPGALGIKRITVAGEPGGSIISTKQRMQDAWHCPVYDHVGATEIGAWSYECTEQTGLHVNEGLFLVQIEDVETGKLIKEPGKKGKMVITAFDRLAQPCIRFDSKDLIQWSKDDVCGCGRTFRKIEGGVMGRADDITKVKGVLLSPTAIEEVVRSIPELSNEHEVTVTKKGDVDDISIKIELMPGQEANRDAVEAKLANLLRLRTNLGYNIEFCEYDSLTRYDVKAKRFKDLRH
jgi:phenylacetate-CoA ligase